MKKFFVLLIVPVIIICFNDITFGGSQSTQMNVSVNVAAGCMITTNPLTFPQITPYISPNSVQASTTIVANCTTDTVYFISIDAGQNYETIRSSRRMFHEGGAFAIYYYIVWDDYATGSQAGDPGYGDTFPQGFLKQGIGNGINQTHTIVGGIGVGDNFINKPLGDYHDTLNVAVHF